MNKVKVDAQTGKAVAVVNQNEKENMKKARVIDENANIALVNLRRSIEAKKSERL